MPISESEVMPLTSVTFVTGVLSPAKRTAHTYTVTKDKNTSVFEMEGRQPNFLLRINKV